MYTYFEKYLFMKVGYLSSYFCDINKNNLRLWFNNSFNIKENIIGIVVFLILLLKIPVWTHTIQILKGVQNLFELPEFVNYRSSNHFGQILKKISSGSFSRCRVLYRLKKSNKYNFFLSEMFISFSITILLNFTEIWESEYCSHCFFIKITRLFHFVQFSLIYFAWDF